MKSYVQFQELVIRAGLKTKCWLVSTNDQRATTLGRVFWFTNWRCYCFAPVGDTVFEKKCLRDIADFCSTQTQAHMDARKAQRNGP